MGIKNLIVRKQKNKEEIALGKLKEAVAYREMIVNKAGEDLDRITNELFEKLNIHPEEDTKKR